MTAGRTTIPESTATWTDILEASRDRMLAAARSGETQGDRLHGGRVVHLHAAEAASTRPRPRSRSPEPDRPVAALAPAGCRADADGRLGAVDRDIAGGPSAADGERSRCVA